VCDNKSMQLMKGGQIRCDAPQCCRPATAIYAATVSVPYGIAACDGHAAWAQELRNRKMDEFHAPTRPEGTE
jgi:hypothetical protein